MMLQVATSGFYLWSRIGNWKAVFQVIGLVLVLALGFGSFSSASPSESMSIMDSLVAHWAMEEGSGTMLIDSSTYGNHAYTSGTPPWQPGPAGLSLYLNGFNQSAQAPNAPSFNMANALTISAWIQPRWRYQQRVVGKGVWTGAFNGYELFLSSVVPYRVCLRINNTGVYSNSTYPTDGSWMHVAATWDGSLMKMYINGALQTSMGYSNPPATVPYNVMIGGISYGSSSSNGYNGGLDEIRVYRRALTAGEVAILAGTATPHIVTATTGPNGTISPSGAVSVYDGENQSFSIAANANYHIQDVRVDASSVGAVSSYTFTNVTQDHTISASFAIDQFAITSSAGENGSIDPLGITMVVYGGNQIYMITPQTGYHIVDVLVDGSSVGAVSSYDFTNVTAPHTISAIFAINTYSLTASAGPHGSIVPTGLETRNYGEDLTYTITPDIGYHVEDVLVDGSSVGPVTSYSFLAIDVDHTIHATFAINTYTISASSDANGSIDPSGTTVLNYGDDLQYSMTPNTDYHILDVVVDGGSVGPVPTYQFTDVSADHTIAVTFELTLVMPMITSSPVLTGRVGTLYSYDVDATGIPAPTYTLSVLPVPQAQLTINNASGLIEWTPSSADVGNFIVTVYAANSVGTASQEFTINVKCCTGVTGNVNMAGIVDLADLSALVSYLTGGGYVLPCVAEANVNNAGIVDLADLSALVSYLTGGGYVLPNCS